MGEFIERVREGLAELRRRDADGGRVFGAGAHRYRLNSPLAEAEVAAFERENGIGLPLDFRAFLSELGNGGAGPFYGVFRLGEMDDNNDDDKKSIAGEFVGDPARAFPYTERWNLPEAELERIQASEDDQEIIRTYWRPVDGAIPLCHEGCALRDWLVVSGPEAGRVWHDATAEFAGWWPCTLHDGRHASFAEWYLSWLDDAVRKAR